jgi:hypothetical protein
MSLLPLPELVQGLDMLALRGFTALYLAAMLHLLVLCRSAIHCFNVAAVICCLVAAVGCSCASSVEPQHILCQHMGALCCPPSEESCLSCVLVFSVVHQRCFGLLTVCRLAVML